MPQDIGDDVQSLELQCISHVSWIYAYWYKDRNLLCCSLSPFQSAVASIIHEAYTHFCNTILKLSRYS